MNRVIFTAIVLIATSSMSYAKCKQAIKTLPDIPDSASATLAEFNAAQRDIAAYADSAKSYASCTLGENNKRSHKRGERAMWKVSKLYNQYNEAYEQFTQRQQNIAMK